MRYTASMRSKYVAIALLATCYFTPTAEALQYTYIEDLRGDSFLLRERGYEKERFYLGKFEPLSFRDTASTSTLYPELRKASILGRSFDRRYALAATTSTTAGSFSYTREYVDTNTTQATSHLLPIDIRRVFMSNDGMRGLATTKQRDVYTIDFSTGAASFVGTVPSGASWITASPDFRYLAYYIPGTQTRGQRTFGILDIATNTHFTRVEKVAYWDLLTEGNTIFAFSPDSTKLIYISDAEDFATPYVVELAKLKTGVDFKGERVITRKYTVADVIWDTSDSWYFVANRNGAYQWSLYHYSLTSKALKEIDAFASFGASLALTDQHLIYSRADVLGVYPTLYARTTGSTTALLLPRQTSSQLPYSKSVTLTGNLKGVYYIEPSKLSNTLIVWLHGGPYRQIASAYNPYWGYGSYDAVLEAVRKTDVGILKIDYPGSAGHGRVFAESITENVGVLDSKKTTAAVRDFAKRNGYTNVFLVGNSYGGYLALKMLVDTPTLFKGSVAIGGVTDWTTLLTKLNDSIFNVQFSGLADEKNYKLHAAASIYNKASALTTQSVVLIHGDKDTTIPVSQAKDFSTYLTSLQKPHQLILMPGEDHVFRKKASFEALCSTLVSVVGKTSTSACAFSDE